MGQRVREFRTFWLVFTALVVISIFVWALLFVTRDKPITWTEIQFKERTNLRNEILSSFADSGIESFQPERFNALSFLDNGEIAVPSLNYIYIFNDDGRQLRKIPVEKPSEEQLLSEGISYQVIEDLYDSGLSYEIAVNGQGRMFLSITYVPSSSEMLMLEWNPDGSFESIEDFSRDVASLGNLQPSSYYRSWSLSSDGDYVLHINDWGAFRYHHNGRWSEFGVLDWIKPNPNYNSFAIANGKIYLTVEYLRKARYNLDGSIDWDWIINTADLFSSDIGVSLSNNTVEQTVFGSIDNGRRLAICPDKVRMLNSSGRTIRTVENPKALDNLRQEYYYNTYMLLKDAGDGYLLNNRAASIYTSIVPKLDYDFNVTGNVEFSQISEEESEYLHYYPSERVIISTVLSEDLLELELKSEYEVGDFVDPRSLRYSLELNGDKFVMATGNRKKLLVMDQDLIVEKVLDFTNPAYGYTLGLSGAVLDTSGQIYLVDFSRDIIQVVDEEGDYIRAHSEVGSYLFGSKMEFDGIWVDTWDRLWITGGGRIVVLDSQGNLLRIFERLNALYSVNPGVSTGIRSHETPVGYTIMASGDFLGQTRNPVVPILLEEEALGFAMPSPPEIGLFYVPGQYNDYTWSIYNWDGMKVGEVDLTDFEGTEVQPLLTMGPDGYLYLIDNLELMVYVYDPLGNTAATILLEDITEPLSSYYYNYWVNEQGELIFLDHVNNKLNFYPLREELVE